MKLILTGNKQNNGGEWDPYIIVKTKDRKQKKKGSNQEGETIFKKLISTSNNINVIIT